MHEQSRKIIPKFKQADVIHTSSLLTDPWVNKGGRVSNSLTYWFRNSLDKE